MGATPARESLKLTPLANPNWSLWGLAFNVALSFRGHCKYVSRFGFPKTGWQMFYTLVLAQLQYGS